MSGLISTNGIVVFGSTSVPSTFSMLGRSSTAETSSTVSCKSSPTCCAARPTPCAACIVSIMFAASSRMRSSICSIRLPLARKIGSPYCNIGRIIFPPG